MSTSRLPPAAQRRSWYLLHTLAVMALLFLGFLFGLLVYSRLTNQAPSVDLPWPLRAFGSLCVVALLWLWVRMLVDFFRERPPKHPVAWGWFLFLGSYIGALAYFWAIWRPRNNPSARPE
jgi:drug/metabolite transporter (DMT)-like permease